MNSSPPFWAWRDMGLFLGLGFPAALLGMAAGAAALHFAPFEQPRAVALLVPQFLGFSLALVPLVLIFRSKYDTSLWSAVEMRMPAGEPLRSALHGTAAAFAVLGLGILLRTPRASTPLEDLMNDPASAPFLAIAAVTVGPFFEELLFRGLLQPLAVRSTGPAAGILLAALPFAILHGPEYGWSWRHVLLILVAGSAFGWKRQQTGSTGAAVLMHAVYNGVLLAGYLLGRNFIESNG